MPLSSPARPLWGGFLFESRPSNLGITRSHYRLSWLPVSDLPFLLCLEPPGAPAFPPLCVRLASPPGSSLVGSGVAAETKMSILPGRLSSSSGGEEHLRESHRDQAGPGWSLSRRLHWAYASLYLSDSVLSQDSGTYVLGSGAQLSLSLGAFLCCASRANLSHPQGDAQSHGVAMGVLMVSITVSGWEADSRLICDCIHTTSLFQDCTLSLL